MKFELINPQPFKTAFESISRIIDETIITFDNEGLHLTAIDRSHISFVTLALNTNFFDEYTLDNLERVAVDTSELMKILKKVKKDDILEWSVDEHNLTLTCKGDAVRKFNIRLIDLEYDVPVPPNIETPVNISVPSQLIVDSLGDMSIFSEKLDFIIDEDYFIIRNDGEFGDAEVKYIHGEQVKEVVKSSFSIPKLEDIFKASRFSKDVRLGLGEDLPLKVQFELPMGDGELNYLLAPRIGEEE